jgi:hypothetical protein
MQKFALLSAITCVLCACSPKEEACDPTGARYAQMMKEGSPFTEKDKACIQANLIKSFEDAAKKLNADAEKQKADEKAHPYKPINWNQTLFPKKQGAGEK